MRSYIVLGGAAALVAASPAPAPQGFDSNLPVTMTGPRGAPVGVGPATVSNVYNRPVALATASAAVTGATAAVATATAAAGKKRSLEERSFCIFGFCFGSPTTSTKATYGATTTTPSAPVKTTAPTTAVPTTTPMYNYVPTTCTPVSWTNTWAFTSATACPSPFEVGTFCGFINPLDPCAAQPYAAGPPTTPDTVENFKNNQVYHQMAQSAQTPSGYIQTFKDLDASVNANSYLAYKQLASYDVDGCAAYCDQTELCTAFNIYIERDPAWNPWQCSCPQPDSVANYKCSIFGSNINSTAATNFGQSRDAFEVIVVASNGYQKGTVAPPTPPSSTNPQDCGKKLHDQPKYCLGQKSFPGPYDASVCAAYALQQNAVNVKSGLISTILSFFGYSPARCVQYQAAQIDIDGAAWGTHCRLFTQKFDKSKASLDISLKSSWSCGKSFTFDIVF